MTRLACALIFPFVSYAGGRYGIGPKTPNEPAAFYADYANSDVYPLPANLDVDKPGILRVEGAYLTLEIPWKSITSLSYATQIKPDERPAFNRVLTIGFYDATKAHHNAVIILADPAQVKLLPRLEMESGIKIGRY